MKHEIATELLNDYHDGELAPPLADELEDHVRQCVTCRRELEGLRQLLKGASALPRSIEPARDLWPAIAELTQPFGSATETVGSRLMQRLGFFSWSWPTALATAAVVGVLFFSSIETQPLLQPQQNAVPAGLAVPADADPQAVALIQALEAECLECERELAAYTGTEDSNESIVTRMLRNSMPVVDRAISEAREAWLASPDEAGLARLLTSAYRAKMALQGRAIRMASET
jgi:hypothetical protein